MEFHELITHRFSVRHYDTRPVEPDKLKAILEAGRIAPTAANLQPQRFIVVNTEKGLLHMQKGARIYGAPLAIIVCADHKTTWKRHYDHLDAAHIDASIATDHMMLAATDLGLGTVWICAFDPAVIRKEFKLPDHVEPVNILVVGYAAEPPKSPARFATERISLEDMVSYGEFGVKG